MSAQNQELIDIAVDAYNTFCSRNPDFNVCEANASLLADAVKRLKLPFHELSSLQHAWTTIRPRSKSAPAPARKPAPAPALEPLEVAIEREAKRILSSGEIEDALQNLSAKQFEQKSYNLAFARALELREQSRVKSLLTRGDLAVAENLANKNGTSVASEISKSEKRMIAAQNPFPASPITERSRGIENPHLMATYSTKRKPTLAQAIARQEEDQKFLDEAAAKTARLIRVKANKGK